MAELYELFTEWKKGNISESEYRKAVAELTARFDKGNEVKR